MKKPVSLSVHRNTKEQRARREAANYLRECAREVSQRLNLTGFLLVAWDKDWNASSRWELGGMPNEVAGEFAKRAYERSLNKLDARDEIDEVFGTPEGS